jgi:YrbI family 3-deoxy-D-manno-octulosonate 8-phosphate phosphatase
MKILAIIPARGGSKGIPQKNIHPLAGKPLIAHTIEAAKEAEMINRVVVSTDDPEIESISETFGAEVIRRPSDISGDNARSEDALLHVMRYLEENEGYLPDLVVFLQCTSPLTTAQDIDGSVNALFNESADTALAVAPFHYFLWERNTSGDAIGINHDKSVRLMRQDQQPQYIETGAVYVMKAQQFKEVGHRFFGKTALYVMPEERCLEIDEPVDLIIAEEMKRYYEVFSAASRLPDEIDGVVFDFDGVFTDNKVLVIENGLEAVVCSRSDGWGLSELRRANVPLVVISKEINPVVAVRCRKLGIDCFHGVDDKLGKLKKWALNRNLELKNIVYLGNDVNDLECLKTVGCPVVVNDAHPDVKPFAKIILKADGGHGAIRELADIILKKQ